METQQTGSKGREKKKGEILVQKKLMKYVYFTKVLKSKEENMVILTVHFRKLLEKNNQFLIQNQAFNYFST